MAWPRSITLTLALLGSLVGHLGLAALDLPDRSEVELEVAEGGVVAALGSSFEDLVSGETTAPAPPSETTETQPADSVAPLAAPASQSPTQPINRLKETALEVQQPSKAADQPAPSYSATAPASPDTGVKAPPTETGFLPADTVPEQAVSVPRTASMAAEPTVTASRPSESLAPTPTPALTPVPTTTAPAVISPSSPAVQPNADTPVLERLEPVDESLIAALPKPRPPLPDFFKKQLEAELEAERQRRAERQARQRVQAQRQQQQRRTEQAQRRQSAPAGNSRNNARRGDASGQSRGNAAQKGRQGGSRERASGNRDAANYPGKVYRKLARTRQPRVGSRGVARVSFSVTGSGGVSRVRIAGSSGNARVDQAAVAHVQRAAPFPRPPQGAQTRFVIPIEFRR